MKNDSSFAQWYKFEFCSENPYENLPENAIKMKDYLFGNYTISELLEFLSFGNEFWTFFDDFLSLDFQII